MFGFGLEQATAMTRDDGEQDNIFLWTRVVPPLSLGVS
jgi:hypothetical protein